MLQNNSKKIRQKHVKKDDLSVSILHNVALVLYVEKLPAMKVILSAFGMILEY
jgi:hypothetical protein